MSKVKSSKSLRLRSGQAPVKSETKVKKKTVKKSSDGKRATLRTQKKTESTESQNSQKNSAPSVLQKTTKASTQRTSAPQTMEELLVQTGYKLRGLRKREEIEGIVTNIGKKKILLDIGAKTEGVVLGKEFELVEDFIGNLKVGDKVKAVVGIPENERGQILLNLRKAADNYKWELFEKWAKTGGEIEVRGLDVNRGGMIARVQDVYGFIPISQFGRQWLGNLEKLYNKLLKVKVIEVDRSKNRLIFSEKAVSEAQALADQEKALKKVKVGDVLEGIVSGIMPFGIFARVDIKEGKEGEEGEEGSLFLEGLVHISEISWEKVENLNKIYKVGSKVKVKVLGIDKASSRLNLSIKQLQPDPWTSLAQKYPSDKSFAGKVTKLVAFGAFVALEPGVEGLIHISKIPTDFDIKVGKKLDVYIENIDSTNRRIALGLVLAKKPVGYK